MKTPPAGGWESGMFHYFVSGATTCYGPINFTISATSGERITEGIENEGRRRGLVICHDWKAEPIELAEFLELTS